MLKLINQLLNKLKTKELKDNVSITDSLTIEVKRGLHKRYLIIARELYKASEPNSETPNLGERRKGRLIVCLVIICFAIESFVNDVLQIKCGLCFDEVERKPLFEKVKKIYKNGNQNILKIIHELIKTRNDLAHYKPNFRKPDDEIEIRYESIDHKKVAEFYSNTVKLMQAISKEQDLGEEFAWLIGYSEDINSAT